MNILVFSWRDLKHPLAGGAEQVMHEHIKGWLAAGHEVTFFSSKFPGAKSEEVIDRVKIIRKGSQYVTSHIAAFWWYEFKKHERFDVVIDEFHGWPFFTPLYVDKPVIAVIQELTREVWFKYQLPFSLQFIFGTIGYILEPFFFLPYRRVKFITGSKSAKDELKTVGIDERNITIIPHGVIIDMPKRKYVKEKIKTVMFLGALARDKGIEDAIKTFGILNGLDKFQFWIVGKGDEEYLKGLKKMARELKLKNVIFWGFVTQAKKFELLQRVHVMVNPSVREGWGLVNIEANRMGTPVVAYNSPGLTDSVKNGVSGVVLNENTPAEMARVVYELFENKSRYAKMQKSAITWSNNFDWSISRKKSLELIQKVYEK